jgi:hypothetical protein
MSIKITETAYVVLTKERVDILTNILVPTEHTALCISAVYYDPAAYPFCSFTPSEGGYILVIYKLDRTRHLSILVSESIKKSLFG